MAVVLGGLLLRRGPSPVDRREEVLDASETFAVALSTYDYRRLDRDFARVEALSSESFKEEYRTRLTGLQFREALVQQETVSSAAVQVGPLLASLRGDEARTFTVLEQTVRTAAGGEPQRRKVRVELFLIDTDKGWKVNRVELT